MTKRCQFGERNGLFGGWISKPGYDVTLASPGQFLLDTNSQVFQKVASGDTAIVTSPGISTYTQSVALPSSFASYSRIVCWAHGYELNTGTGTVTWDDNYNGRFDYKARTGGGVLTLTVVSTVNYGPVTPPRQLRITWVLFRALF